MKAFLEDTADFPKIYIQQNSQNVYEDQCDCDCACIKQSFRQSSKSSCLINNISRDEIENETLILAEHLVISAINNYISLFNPAYGNLIVLNKSAYKSILKLQTPFQISDHISDSILHSKFFIKNFFSILETEGMLQQIDSPPLFLPCTFHSHIFTAWLHLTNQCNLQCAYCYVNKAKKDMSLNTARQTLKAIFQRVVSNNYNEVILKYAGGEPTLQPDVLMQTHQMAEVLADKHQVGLEGRILSNGYAIPDSLFKFTREHRVKWAISLDGPEKLHNIQRPSLYGGDSFQRAQESIEKLHDDGMSPHIIITLTSLNVDDAPELVTWLLERKLRFSINFYRQTGYCKERDPLRPETDALILALRKIYAVIEHNLPEYSLLSLLLDRVDLSAPHERPCTAGYHYAAIGTQGQVVPCQMLISHPAAVSRDSGIPLMPEVSYPHFQNPPVSEKEGCSNECSWYYFCAGGCPLEAFRTYNRYDMRSPYCEVYREMAPEVLRLEALRLLEYGKPVDLTAGSFN